MWLRDQHTYTCSAEHSATSGFAIRNTSTKAASVLKPRNRLEMLKYVTVSLYNTAKGNSQPSSQDETPQPQARHPFFSPSARSRSNRSKNPKKELLFHLEEGLFSDWFLCHWGRWRWVLGKWWVGSPQHQAGAERCPIGA